MGNNQKDTFDFTFQIVKSDKFRFAGIHLLYKPVFYNNRKTIRLAECGRVILMMNSDSLLSQWFILRNEP